MYHVNAQGVDERMINVIMTSCFCYRHGIKRFTTNNIKVLVA